MSGASLSCMLWISSCDVLSPWTLSVPAVNVGDPSSRGLWTGVSAGLACALGGCGLRLVGGSSSVCDLGRDWKGSGAGEEFWCTVLKKSVILRWSRCSLGLRGCFMACALFTRGLGLYRPGGLVLGFLLGCCGGDPGGWVPADGASCEDMVRSWTGKGRSPLPCRRSG